MRSKKILLTLLAACSCLPSVSALEIKKTSSKPNTESKPNSNENNSAKTMNPLIPGGIGFVAGAGIAGVSSGFGVRHFKNQEIDKDKNQLTTLTNKIATLQTENNTLRQKNEKFESKLTEFRNQHSDIATGKTDEQIVDTLFESFDKCTKVSKLYDTLITSLNDSKKEPASYINPEFPFGWNENNRISYLDLLAHPEANEKVNPEKVDSDAMCYVVRCQAGLLEALFDPQADQSTFVADNYKLDKAKSTENDMTLKPRILKVD